MGWLTAVDDGELLEDVVGVAVVVVDQERPHRRLLRALLPAGPQRRGTPGAAPAQGVLPPRGGRRRGPPRRRRGGEAERSHLYLRGTVRPGDQRRGEGENKRGEKAARFFWGGGSLAAGAEIIYE